MDTETLAKAWPNGVPDHIVNAYTIRVCQCCMLVYANGECCTEYALLHSDGTPCFDSLCSDYRTNHIAVVDGSAPLLHGGDGCEPLSSIASSDGLAMGMGWEEHAEDCERYIHQGYGPNEGYECECERDTFSRSQCEGCGSYLHGTRYAMTVFPGERTAG